MPEPVSSMRWLTASSSYSPSVKDVDLRFSLQIRNVLLGCLQDIQ